MRKCATCSPVTLRLGSFACCTTLYRRCSYSTACFLIFSGSFHLLMRSSYAQRTCRNFGYCPKPNSGMIRFQTLPAGTPPRYYPTKNASIFMRIRASSSDSTKNLQRMPFQSACFFATVPAHPPQTFIAKGSRLCPKLKYDWLFIARLLVKLTRLDCLCNCEAWYF
jgi:hypothetical protein